jgi:predicted alpha/beta-fold hydrolase
LTKNDLDELKRPILAVIPGLTGGKSALYTVCTALYAKKYGYDMVLLNYRG